MMFELRSNCALSATVRSSEAARVAAPGGRVALSTWDVPAEMRMFGVFLEAVADAGAGPPAGELGELLRREVLAAGGDQALGRSEVLHQRPLPDRAPAGQPGDAGDTGYRPSGSQPHDRTSQHRR